MLQDAQVRQVSPSDHSKTPTALLSLSGVFLKDSLTFLWMFLLFCCKYVKKTMKSYVLYFFPFIIRLITTNILLLWQSNGPLTLAVLHCIWFMGVLPKGPHRVTNLTGHSPCNICFRVSHVKWCVQLKLFMDILIKKTRLMLFFGFIS